MSFINRLVRRRALLTSEDMSEHPPPARRKLATSLVAFTFTVLLLTPMLSHCALSTWDHESYGRPPARHYPGT